MDYSIYLILIWLGPGGVEAFGERRPVAGASNPKPSFGKGSGSSDAPIIKPRHWYSLELDVTCQVVKLIEDPEFSSKAVPIYDLVYLASSPAAQVRRIPDIALKLAEPNQMQSQTRIVAEGIAVPNDVGVLPQGSIGGMTANVWWIAAGNIGSNTAGREAQTGQVYMLDMTKQAFNPQTIVSSPGYGFTHIDWVDMDLDGNADAIAIRTKPTGSELIWMQQPPTNSKWAVSVIDKDVGGNQFKTMWIKDGDSDRLLIIVAGARDAQLAIYWVDDPDNDWTRTSRIQKNIIGKDGSYVNVEIVDVNGDGRLDILTSVTGMRGQPGKVLCYEVPENTAFNKGVWRKHVLSQEFEPSTNYRTLSPGGVYAFYPGKSPTEKPSILVSGADDGKVYVLKPKSWSSYIWHYTTTIILKRNSRIGVPAVADVDGDGNVEIFVPELNYIHVLTYKGVEAPESPESRTIGAKFTGVSTFLAVALSVCYLL